MEFKMLGPLEVWDGAAPLLLRGRRQRALLAILLLNANEVVSSDRLIHELWAETAPGSGVTALQVRVSQLRRSLAAGGGGGELIVTRTPGYVLRTAPERIDARRFERLLAEGRSLLAESEPARAAETLRAALGLWRGPALADFAFEPFAQSEIARLEELRVAALEERLAAELVLGGHGEVVGELEALVTEHPLRERLRAQLMIALHRCGRQGEALDVYRDTRKVLVEELGLEPGEELRRLQSQILAQDPALLPPQRPPGEVHGPGREPTLQERKLVTVLFADLVGSTELVRAGDPERARALLDRYYEGMALEIDAAGGTAEKFAGDAVLAVFGAPSADASREQSRALAP